MCALAPQTEAEKQIRRNLQGKICKCTPSRPGIARVNFYDIFSVQGRLGASIVVLDRLLKATTKKGRQLLCEEISATADN